MPVFNYIAVDAKGEEISGSLDAGSEAEAISKLRQSGVYPTAIVQEGKGKLNVKKGKGRGKGRSRGRSKEKSVFSSGKIKGKALMIFTRQLATLIDSGLPLLRGLTVLGKQEPNPVLKRTINNLADSVQTGSTFSESLAQHPKIFNKLYV